MSSESDYIKALPVESILNLARENTFANEDQSQAALTRLSDLAMHEGHETMLSVLLAILSEEPEEVSCVRHESLAMLAEAAHPDGGEGEILRAAAAVLKSASDMLGN